VLAGEEAAVTTVVSDEFPQPASSIRSMALKIPFTVLFNDRIKASLVDF
jgi:hypothetical protein